MTPTDFLSSRFHYAFGAHKPTLTVQPGAALRVTCPDCDNVMADGSALTQQQRHVDTPDTVQGNPLAGPIHIEGAEPGDTLAVTIDSIELDRDWGITLLAPGHGVVPDELLISKRDGDSHATPVPPVPRVIPRHMYRWHIDTQAGTATMTNPLGGQRAGVPLNPFVGCIGVCPADGRSVSSLYCGPFGGNLDLPLIRPGATVFLPVYRDGALLMIGDVHAAQGHGEIIGGGIETSGKIGCTLNVMKRFPLTGFGVCDGQVVCVISTHDELRRSIQQACAGLVDWLVRSGDMDRLDLYNLVSQIVTITVGNLNERPYPAAAGVRIDQLPATLQEVIHRWDR
jgi:amidase